VVTTRTPIDRPARPPITRRAVQLWEAMQRIECTCPPRNWSRYWEHEICDGCAERNRLRRGIHAELQLKPWEIPAVMAPDAPNPWPVGSRRHAGWRPNADAVERWLALEAAARELRRAT
jgi:hypothetical protein